MATVQELAKWVIASFDRTQTNTVERACAEALHSRGLNPIAAATEASEKARRVLAILRDKSPEELPFEFSDSVQGRLVGKQRPRKGDSPETTAARRGLALVSDMVEALYRSGDCTFEKICAAIMLLSGAQEAFAGCASDDGGIDIYGRIPLRLRDEHIKAGILQTVILQRSLFFLGQCKCYDPTKAIGPGEIHEFYGSVEACRRKYEDNPRPPSHRVPETYYKRGEISISMFFTTGTFTSKAEAAAEADSIILVTGVQIAQFLIHHGVAVVARSDGELAIEGSALDTWAGSAVTAQVRPETG